MTPEAVDITIIILSIGVSGFLLQAGYGLAYALKHHPEKINSIVRDFKKSLF